MLFLLSVILSLESFLRCYQPSALWLGSQHSTGMIQAHSNAGSDTIACAQDGVHGPKSNRGFHDTANHFLTAPDDHDSVIVLIATVCILCISCASCDAKKFNMECPVIGMH